MHLRINSRIDRQTKLSYATEEETYSAYTLDCGEGINTVLTSAQVEQAVGGLTLAAVREYPHGQTLKGAIQAYWEGQASVDAGRIFLTDGSIGALYLINRLFLEPGDRVLGYCPQFSEYGTDVRTYCDFDAVRLRAEDDYAFDVEALLGALTKAHTLIYLDNPNNPTGQILPLEAVERVCKAAAAQDTAVVVDEAYGEYMQKQASAVCLTGQYDNLFVVRSFSKGYGLAGLRAGYMIAPKSVCKPLSNITNPYAMGVWARQLAFACLQDSAFPLELQRRTAALNAELYELPLQNLRFAKTADTVSISLLSHRDLSLDLCAAFRAQGIFVITGYAFQGLHKSAVRLRVPKKDAMPQLLEAIMVIDRL